MWSIPHPRSPAHLVPVAHQKFFLFNHKGKLAYHGAIDDNASDANAVEAAYLKDALDALLAGKDISISETKALGCSIKFNEDS